MECGTLLSLVYRESWQARATTFVHTSVRGWQEATLDPPHGILAPGLGVQQLWAGGKPDCPNISIPVTVRGDPPLSPETP